MALIVLWLDNVLDSVGRKQKSPPARMPAGFGAILCLDFRRPSNPRSAGSYEGVKEKEIGKITTGKAGLRFTEQGGRYGAAMHCHKVYGTVNVGIGQVFGDLSGMAFGKHPRAVGRTPARAFG